MHVYRDIAALSESDRVLVLGNFDGVHLGHQALIRLARERADALGARACAVTFDPHPSQVLAPELSPPLISTFEQRVAQMEAHGLDEVVALRFGPELAKTSPEEFVERYLVPSGAREIVVGYDFSFGKDRAGSPETLSRLCAKCDVRVHVVSPVTIPGGLVPSSSKIREYVLEGRVDAAARLLGRPFEVQGEVVRGAGRGTTLGFPTANVQPENELLPARGVYAVRVRLPGREDALPGAANVGVNPTFTAEEGVARTHLEVHLLDYDGEPLNGRTVRVGFVARLRAEQRFPSVDALKKQIRADVERARGILAGS